MRRNDGTSTTTLRPGVDKDGQRRRELAKFIKSMRERIRPEDAGLQASPRRRAPGLLRDEVAQLAGISSTWYTWMEQSRATSASPRVLDGLAKALRLSPFERAHLFRLARPEFGQSPSPVTARPLGEPFAAVLRGLSPHPAYAVNARWDALAWNDAAARVLGDFGAPGQPHGNVLTRLFLDSNWRVLFADWGTVATSAVHQFRGSTAALWGDEGFENFVADLSKASSEFAALWLQSEVQAPVVWRKTLNHPQAGRIDLDYASLRAEPPELDITFIIYTPADRNSARSLRKLCRP
jgi:transcriptional regulator with XRE-family HTH domain